LIVHHVHSVDHVYMSITKCSLRPVLGLSDCRIFDPIDH